MERDGEPGIDGASGGKQPSSVASSRQIWSGWLWLAGTWLLALLPAFFLRFPLPPEGALVAPAWWVSLSASKYGLPVTAVLLLLLARVKRRELAGLVLPVLILIGFGAAFNEHLFKPFVGEPRPHIEWLSSPAAGPVLVQGAEAFYRLPDKAVRSERLSLRLRQSGLELPALLVGHWIEETGYSFPSGHAFASAALGGWFMLWLLRTRRHRWLLLPLGLWVVAVGYSRLLLGVHYPWDVLAGMALGLLLVPLAEWLRTALVQRFSAMATV